MTNIIINENNNMILILLISILMCNVMKIY